MNLISCGNCGVVLDTDCIGRPITRGDDGQIIESHAAWETISENNQRKKKHGTERLGENCPHSKLTTGAVIKIRKHYALTMKKVDIARMYGVSESAINAVINHRSWRHV